MNNAQTNKPSRFAWFVFRCLARYFISLFIPCFRFFGETCFKHGGQIFITRNYGLQTWLYPLYIFKRPLRFVMADSSDDSKWFEMASSSGLNPIKLTGHFEIDLETIKNMVNSKEKIILIISDDEDDSLSLNLTKALKETYDKETLFMAVSGAKKVFAQNSSIPKVIPVSLFCGMPFMNNKYNNSVFSELNFLERAVSNLKLEDEPSIFENHKKNL